MDIFFRKLTKKSALTAMGIAVLVLIASGYALLQFSKSRTFQSFGVIIPRVNTQDKIVALTFDDGPAANVEGILRILKEKDIKATFYVVGGNLEKYPEAAKKIVQGGHEMGNHSYSHVRLVFRGMSSIADEISRTDQLIRSAGYVGDITFRPPNGKKLFLLPLYLAQNHIVTIMWDVEPDTYYSGDVEKIIGHTLDKVQPGSIILLHPFCGVACEADRKALPAIIDGLKAKGYSFVTVNDLLRSADE